MVKNRLLAPLAVCASLFAVMAAGAAERTITDMADRKVELEIPAQRVVTLGSVPVINSFVFALGGADRIVSGLPEFARRPGWKYQLVFAPKIADLPQMQDANRAPSLEAILRAKPDVAITLDRSSVDPLAGNGVPTVFLSWREPEDVKTVMTVLGDVLGKPEQAAAYGAYFDSSVADVKTRLAKRPALALPKVLYMDAKTLSQPHLIAEWWIEAAGGASVTAGKRSAESLSFTVEQLLAWDPDVIFLATPADRKTFFEHPAMKELRAAKAGRVHVVPTGAHRWGNRTIEQPLTVTWAASLIHPELFADVKLTERTTDFYQRFFGHALTEAQVAEILSGTL